MGSTALREAQVLPISVTAEDLSESISAFGYAQSVPQVVHTVQRIIQFLSLQQQWLLSVCYKPHVWTYFGVSDVLGSICCITSMLTGGGKFQLHKVLQGLPNNRHLHASFLSNKLDYLRMHREFRGRTDLLK